MRDTTIIPYRWLGAGLGLLVLGPIGGIVGWFVGRKLDRRQEHRRLQAENRGLRQEAVAAAVVVLAAKLAKADGQVSAAEIGVFKNRFRIPPEEELRVARLWDEAKKSASGYEPQAWQLAQAYAGQPAMLERIYAVLHEIAHADGDGIRPEETAFLKDVARIFRLRDMGGAFDGAPFPELRVNRASDVAEMEAALGDLFIPPGRQGGLDTLLDRLEPRFARLTVWLGEKWDGMLASPASRPFYALTVGGVFGAAAHFFLLSGLPFLFPYSNLLWSALGGLAVAAVTYAAFPRPKSLEDELAEAARKANLDPKDVAGAIQDAKARIEAIREAARDLEETLRHRVEVILETATRIVDGFRSDPGDLRRSRRFLGHYLVATEDLVIRYADLVGKGVSTERLDKVVAKFGPVLDEINEAFEKQYQRNLEDDALQLDVEIDVLRQTIRSEAL